MPSVPLDEAFARGLIEASPDALIVSDADGRIVLVNAKTETLFGYPRRELLGQAVAVVLPTPLSGAPLVGRHKSGTEFPVEITLSPVGSLSGTLRAASIRDATDRLEATRALRETEERFRFAFDDAPHGMALMSLEGHYERVNRALCRLVGYSAAELLTMSFQTITHPDDLEQDLSLATRLIRGEIPSYELEKRYICKDGHVVDIVLSISLLRDRDGRTPLKCIAHIQDVTERKRAEADLRRLTTKYRELFDQAADGIFIADLEGHYCDVNDAACEMVGYTREELLGMTISDLISSEDVARLAQTRAELLLPERKVVSEWHLCRKDGSVLAVEVSARILADGRWQALVRDVSARNRAAEALRHSEATLALAQRVAGLGIWDWNILTNEVVHSAELFAIFGLVPSDRYRIRGTMPPQHIPPEDLELLERQIAESVRDNKPYIAEHRVVRPDGTERVVVQQGEPVFEDGRAVRLVGTVLDITERKRSEREREQTLLRLQTILDEVSVGILVLSPAGDRVEPNRRALGWMGRRPGTLADYADIILAADGKRLAAEALPGASALRGEGREWAEYQLRTASGAIVPVVVGEAPIVAADGGVQGAVVSFQDITPVKQLDRLRTEWGTIVGHDLRQPLNVVGMRCDLLLKQLGPGADAGARRSIEQIRRSVRMLGRMVGDLMDLSRLEAHRLELVREPVDVVGLARDSVERLPEKDGRHIDVRVLGAVPKCSADPDRVAQVMDNLLSNAVKYGSPNTPILVEVAPAAGGVSVAVTNEGPGIAPQDLPRLFSRFERADRTRGPVKGVGLGLYITRGLVEAHGGHIEVSSTPGRTTFEFVLPAA